MSGGSERLWSIPVQPSIDDLVHHAARRAHRPKASFVRWAVLRELQRMGMLDADLKPITRDQWPSIESLETTDVSPENHTV